MARFSAKCTWQLAQQTMVWTTAGFLLEIDRLLKRRHNHTPKPIIIPSIIKRGKPIALLLGQLNSQLKALSVPVFWRERAILGKPFSALIALGFSDELLAQ